MTITVINNLQGFKTNTFYIGRPSILGNPFFMTSERARQRVIDDYRVWLNNEMMKKGEVFNEMKKILILSKTHDVHLKCYCSPKPCHGDVIKEVIEKGFDV